MRDKREVSILARSGEGRMVAFASHLNRTPRAREKSGAKKKKNGKRKRYKELRKREWANKC